MRKRISIKGLAPLAFAVMAFMVTVPALAQAQVEDTGNVAGFVYDGDGKSPIKEAVVILKLAKKDKDDKEYKSEPTGETGAFQMAGLPGGVYVAAVRVKSGKVYNTLSVVKITAGKRLIRSFYLTPERPLAMLWKNPCGIAMILAGTAVVTRLVVEEPEEVSPTQL